MPRVKNRKPSADKELRADRDAVALLLSAFGYPTIPPEPPRTPNSRVHKAISETDDDEEA